MANRYSVETIFKAIDKISAPVSRMQKRVKDFTESASKGLKKAADTTWAWTKGLTAAGSAAAGAFVTAAGGIALFVTETNKANAEMANMAKAMGLTESHVRAMDAILRPAGLNWENFTDIAEELRNKLGEKKAAGKMKKFDEALGYMGLKWKDLKNLKPEKILQKILDGLHKIEDPAKKAFISDEIFGGEGNKIIGILDATGDAYTELMKKYEKINFYSEKGASSSKKFMDALSPLAFMADSVKSQIAGLLGGAMVPYIKSATDWAEANKSIIDSDISKLVDNLIKLFEQLAPKLEANESWIGKIADAVGWLADNAETIKTWAGYIFKAAIAFFVLSAALKAMSLIMAVVNLVMAANPVVLITLAIIALIAVVAYVIDRFIGWGNALKIVGAAILLAMGPIGWIIGAAVRIYKNWETVSGFFKNLWTSVVDSFKFAKDWISTYIDGIVTKVQGLISLASGITGKVRGWFGGGGSAEAAGASVSSPQQRTANQISEKRNVSEVTIFDKTGQAKQTKGKPGNGVRLAHSGGFN